MGWLIALGIVTLLAVLPLGASISYDSSGAVVKLIVGPLKITLFPRPKKDKKPKKEKKTPKEVPLKEEPRNPQPEPAPGSQQPQKTEKPLPKPEKAKEEEKPNQEEQPKQEDKPKKQSGGPITDFLPLVRILLDMLGAFRRKLRLNVLELKLIMAADDPCDLAINYGRAWAAVGNLLPQLEKVFVIKKRNIEVECDFEAAETRVIARLDLTITLGRIIGTVLYYGGKAGMEFMKINKKRKGGASK